MTSSCSFSLSVLTTAATSYHLAFACVTYAGNKYSFLCDSTISNIIVFYRCKLMVTLKNVASTNRNSDKEHNPRDCSGMCWQRGVCVRNTCCIYGMCSQFNDLYLPDSGQCARSRRYNINAQNVITCTGLGAPSSINFKASVVHCFSGWSCNTEWSWNMG